MILFILVSYDHLAGYEEKHFASWTRAFVSCDLSELRIWLSGSGGAAGDCCNVGRGRLWGSDAMVKDVGERVRLVGRKFECIEFMKQLFAQLFARGAVPKLVWDNVRFVETPGIEATFRATTSPAQVALKMLKCYLSSAGFRQLWRGRELHGKELDKELLICNPIKF